MADEIERAKAGDRDAAVGLLEGFINAHEMGVTVRDSPAKQYIVDCLKDAIAGKKDPFNLKKRAGLKESDGRTTAGFKMAVAIAEKLKVEPDGPLPRGAIEKAIRSVTNGSEEKIDRARRNWSRHGTSALLEVDRRTPRPPIENNRRRDRLLWLAAQNTPIQDKPARK